ncbi:MAG TPA: hypothetical protein PLE73_06530 [Spirochaetota bacterium]|nr:hypothetical protein [Spirochaetota bacterium]HOS38664.1 hypothetical protein [Spirochaetota bacterium]HPI22836.1 hypothetical protein [Spirochaetota bacterium]HPU87494.1 hypothetical protein [Spirochaetota bacterium]
MRRSRGALFSVVMIAAVVARCASGPRAPQTGWAGDDIYRVAVEAPAVARDGASAGSAAPVSRRATLERAAELARERVLRDFADQRAKALGASGAGQRAWLQLTFDRDIRDAIARGTIVYRSFRDDRSCAVVFQVRREGLRGRVEGENAKEAR